MPKKDLNQTAFAILQQATGEASEPIESARVKASRKGGLTGGVGRAKSLTKEQRTDIARTAAAARWKKR